MQQLKNLKQLKKKKILFLGNKTMRITITDEEYSFISKKINKNTTLVRNLNTQKKKFKESNEKRIQTLRKTLEKKKLQKNKKKG